MTEQPVRPVARGQRARLVEFARDALLYGGTGVATRLLSLITFPVVTRALGRELYGVVDALGVMLAAVSPFMTLGINAAIARFYYDCEDPERRREIVSQGFEVLLASSIAVTGIVLAAAPWIVEAFFGSREWVSVLRLAVVANFFGVVVAFAQNLLRWTFSRRGFVALSIGWLTLSAGLVVVCVWHLRLGAAGVFGAYLAGNIVASLAGLAMVRHLLAPVRRRPDVPDMLSYGWPIMLTVLFAALLPSVDRLLVQRLFGSDELGLYAVGAKVASLVALAGVAFNMVWGPFSLAIHRERDANSTYEMVLRFLVLALVPSAILLAGAAPALIAVLASRVYLPAAALVAPLAFAAVEEAIAEVSGIGIVLSKRTGWLLVTRIAGLAATVASVLLLTHRFGLVGIAFGVLVGRFATLAAATAAAYAVHPHRFRVSRPLGLAVFGLAIAMVPSALPGVGTFAQFVLSLFGAVVWIGLAAQVILNRRERRAVWTTILDLRAVVVRH